MKRLSPAELPTAIAALDALDLAALQQKWRDLYKVPPPNKVRAKFLRLAIAYRLQELTLGGLSAQTRRDLRRVAAEAREHRPRSGKSEPETNVIPIRLPRRRILSPGTRLVREWNGTTEVVDVLASGFGWKGKTYRTLSAVAVAITGTKWSGPKFFGLTDTKTSAKPAAAGMERSPAVRGVIAGVEAVR